MIPAGIVCHADADVDADGDADGDDDGNDVGDGSWLGIPTPAADVHDLRKDKSEGGIFEMIVQWRIIGNGTTF